MNRLDLTKEGRIDPAIPGELLEIRDDESKAWESKPSIKLIGIDYRVKYPFIFMNEYGKTWGYKYCRYKQKEYMSKEEMIDHIREEHGKGLVIVKYDSLWDYSDTWNYKADPVKKFKYKIIDPITGEIIQEPREFVK